MLSQYSENGGHKTVWLYGWDLDSWLILGNHFRFLFSPPVFSACTDAFHCIYSATRSLTNFVFEIRFYKSRGFEQLTDLVFGSTNFWESSPLISDEDERYSVYVLPSLPLLCCLSLYTACLLMECPSQGWQHAAIALFAAAREAGVSWLQSPRE